MGRKACIVIKKTQPYEFYHNSREHKTKNSIFNKDNNEINATGSEAKKMYEEYLKEVEQIYRERTGQKLQKNVIKLFSAVIVLDERHTLQDVKKVAKYLQETLGTRVFQIAVHRDEGHLENGKPKINYHAHIIFAGLDKEGRSVRRKLTRYYLSDLQDKVAELLNMPRGIKRQGNKHLDYRSYKTLQKEKEKLEITYKTEISELKTENKLLKARVGKLEKENSRLQMQLQFAKETVKTLRKKMIEINNIRKQQQEQIIFLQKDYKELSSLKKKLNVDNAEEILNILREKEKRIKELEKKLKTKEKTISDPQI